MTQWSRDRLADLFGGLELANDGALVVTGIAEGLQLDGEAFINVRKGKLIPSYELDLKVPWKAVVRDGEGNAVVETSGKLHLPYIAEENHDEDPEVKARPPGRCCSRASMGAKVLPRPQVVLNPEQPTAADARIKDAILKQGKGKILAAVQAFVKEIHAGGPVTAKARCPLDSLLLGSSSRPALPWVRPPWRPRPSSPPLRPPNQAWLPRPRRRPRSPRPRSRSSRRATLSS